MRDMLGEKQKELWQIKMVILNQIKSGNYA